MLYCNPEPIIIVTSLRPLARRSFTCAHELGHLQYGHGTTVDELFRKSPQTGFDSKEFAADGFAGALLMPKITVQRAFSLRGWSIEGSTPGEIYTVSNHFRIGYSTPVHHLSNGLGLLPRSSAQDLRGSGRGNLRPKCWAGNLNIRELYAILATPLADPIRPSGWCSQRIAHPDTKFRGSTRRVRTRRNDTREVHHQWREALT